GGREVISHSKSNSSPTRLIPLIGFISVGLGSAVLYLLRLALYSPDVRYGRGGPGPSPALAPEIDRGMGNQWDGRLKKEWGERKSGRDGQT
uniref:Uncharacterized protein n=1 Tax=Athene cunicularia TaxID=194338 RepID=A0A663NF73_ATHCN